MAVRSSADAEWKGSLKEGSGRMRFGSGAYHGDFTFASRFETGKGTNPEELLAAAHAGCFSMQLSGLLTAGGTPPKRIRTKAHVTIEAGVGITRIELETEADVTGIAEAAFMEAARKAREICPVSKALAAVKEITLKAKLI
ncbi:MAG: OsmC family peroxiredoxin [Bauldia sp.]